MTKAQLLRQLRNYQSYIISFIILVVVGWMTTNFLLPNIDKIKQSLEERKGQDRKISALLSKLSALSKVDKSGDLSALRQITSVLPEEKDAFSIFTGLDTLEKDSSVFITHSDFRIGVVSTEAALLRSVANGKFGYQPIDIIFEVVGTPDQIIALLHNLVSFKTRLFTARNISVNLVDPAHITADFTLTTYYQPFPAQLGSAERPLPLSSEKQNMIKAQIVQNAPLPETQEELNIIHGKTNLFSP